MSVETALPVPHLPEAETAGRLSDAAAARTGRGVVGELVRLGIVLVGLATGFAAVNRLGAGSSLDEETARLAGAALGALTGYVVGGVLARLLLSGVDRAQRDLQRVAAPVLIAGALGTSIGVLLGLSAVVPLLFLPARGVTVPLAVVVLVLLGYAGGRIGASRGGDLSRYVGVRGRLEVTNPSRGGATKLVDTSALMDARLVDVARRGFLDGTLVVPLFVLEELQGLADGSDRRRAAAAHRGLDALRTLQQEALVAVEVADVDVPGVRGVDAKLAAICRERQAALVTVDGNLERIAEIAGLRVLNLHGLADALRPPALPGDRVDLVLVRAGQQAGQAIGYLEDGTMVVVEDAGDAVGDQVMTVITSITQTRRGRMLFARRAEA